PQYQAAPIMPAGYQAPAPAVAPGQPAPLSQQAQVWMTTLRESLYPAQREWAAQNMASLDPATHPQVGQALLLSARQDPAATVRAGCVNCLARMKVCNAQVIADLTALKADGDSRVRQEVEQALVRLTPGQARSSDQLDVQPVRAEEPHR